MRCKFCGCTEDNACQVPVKFDEQEPGGAMLWAGNPAHADAFVPCYWIAPEICCSLPCVKKAYDEAVAANCRRAEINLIPPELAEQVLRYLRS